MEQDKRYVKSTITGTLWVYASRYSGKFVNLISLMVLARLLTQEDFGVAGYAIVVLSFLDFPGLGIGSALVYFPRDPRRTNTAFWTVQVIGLVMAGIMLLGAPLVGMYFNDPRAVPVTRWLALYFPLVALGVIPSSLLSKELSFRKKFFPDLIGAASKGVVSISLAFLGWGAFSLVSGNLAHTLAAAVVLWLVWPSKWRPAFAFDRELVGPMLKFGFSVVSLYALGILLLNVDYLIVGRYLGAAALGVYLLAFRIPELMIKQFYASISEVLFPVFTRMRENDGDLASGFLTTMRYVALMTVPMAVGLALIADPLIRTFFGDRWEDAIPITAAIAIYTLIRSLYFSAGDVFKAQGRPEIVTRLHLLNLAILIPALLWAVLIFESLEAVAWMQVAVVSVVGLFRMWVAGRLLNLPLIEFGRVLAPILSASALMGLAVLAVMMLTENAPPPLRLALGILTGAAVYTAAIWWIKPELLTKAGRTLRTVLSKA